MAFQSAVFLKTCAGVPGEIFSSYPHRAQSFQIQSASDAYNIIGATAFTVSAEGIALAGNGSGYLSFAGFLFNPKVYALHGTFAGGTLAPTLTLRNFIQAEFITEGSLWVTLPNTANIGDVVIYDNVTGAISSISPVTALPSGHTFANAQVDYFSVTVAGLAVISITPLILGTAV